MKATHYKKGGFYYMIQSTCNTLEKKIHKHAEQIW